MDRSDPTSARSTPDLVAWLGLLVVGGCLTIAVRVSPVPWHVDTPSVTWAFLAVAAAMIGAWRRRLGVGVLGLAAVAVALSPTAVDPNEVAGALAPTVPIVLSWVIVSRSGPTRGLAGLVLVALGVRLAVTTSRGGVAALSVGLGVFLVLGSAAVARRRWLGGLSAAGVVAVVAVTTWPETIRRVADLLLRPGEADGWSWNHLLTGRPMIWDRAVEMLSDLPRWGIGPGRFDDVLLAYPRSASPGPGPGDAHQAMLQHALDLGLPGAAVVLVSILLGGARVIRATLDTADGSPRRWLLAGLAGAFAGHLAFGVVDAVPLGSPAALVGWSLLGLALSSAPRPAHRAQLGTAGASAAMLAVVLTGWMATAPVAELDHASRNAVRAILGHGDDAEAIRSLDAIAPRHPRSLWLRGVLDAVAGRVAERDAAWSRLVAATPARTGLLATVAPRHEPLARFAVRRWPTAAGSWRWLADADPDSARRALRRALALDPDALDAAETWLAIGRLDERAGARRAALDAYAQACRAGDPGANACPAAGRLAEALGDPQRAAALYRHSRWPDVRQLADRERTERSPR